jgi:hypothetical protein
MDAGGAGQASESDVDAERELARCERNLRVWAQNEVPYLRALVATVESDLRRLKRSVWIMRGMVFMNLVNACWCLSGWPRWSAYMAPVAVWGAGYAFRCSEKLVADIRPLEARQVRVREQMKNIERLANESGT